MKELGYSDAGLEGKEEGVAGTQLAANRSTLFSDLPAEVLLNIFSHLTTKQLLEQRKVSKLHRDLAVDSLFKTRFDNEAMEFKLKFLRSLNTPSGWSKFKNNFIGSSEERRLTWVRIFYGILRDPNSQLEHKELANIYIMLLDPISSEPQVVAVYNHIRIMDNSDDLVYHVNNYKLVFESSSWQNEVKAIDKSLPIYKTLTDYQHLFQAEGFISYVNNTNLISKLDDVSKSELKSYQSISSAIKYILDPNNQVVIKKSMRQKSWVNACIILFESIPKYMLDRILRGIIDSLSIHAVNNIVMYSDDIHILMHFIIESDDRYFRLLINIMSKNSAYSNREHVLNLIRFNKILDKLSSNQLDNIAVRLCDAIDSIPLTNYTNSLVFYLVSHNHIKDIRLLMSKVLGDFYLKKLNVYLLIEIIKASSDTDLIWFLDKIQAIIRRSKSDYDISKLMEYLRENNQVLYYRCRNKSLLNNSKLANYDSMFCEDDIAEILSQFDIDSNFEITPLMHKIRNILETRSLAVWRQLVIDIIHTTEQKWRKSKYENERNHVKGYLLLSRLTSFLDDDVIYLLVNQVCHALDKSTFYSSGSGLSRCLRGVLINIINFHCGDLVDETLSRCFNYLFKGIVYQYDYIMTDLIDVFSFVFEPCWSISHLISYMPSDYQIKYSQSLLLLLENLYSNDLRLSNQRIASYADNLMVMIEKCFQYLENPPYDQLAHIFFTKVIHKSVINNDRAKLKLISMLKKKIDEDELSIVAYEDHITKSINTNLSDSHQFFRYMLLAKLIPYFSESTRDYFLMKLPQAIVFPAGLSETEYQSRENNILALLENTYHFIPNQILVTQILFILNKPRDTLLDISIDRNKRYFNLLRKMLYRVRYSSNTANLVYNLLSKLSISSEKANMVGIEPSKYFNYYWNYSELLFIFLYTIYPLIQNNKFSFDLILNSILDILNDKQFPCTNDTSIVVIFRFINLVYSKLSASNWSLLIDLFIEWLTVDQIQVGANPIKFTKSQIYPQLISLFCKNKACLEVLLGHLDQEQFAGRDDVFSLKLIFMTALNTNLEANLTPPDDGYVSRPALSV